MLARTRFSALEPIDDATSSAELRLFRLREQVAVVRAIADHVDEIARPGDVDDLGEQLIEEATRLLETASAMSRTSNHVARDPRHARRR
jgi:hypothetical protein